MQDVSIHNLRRRIQQLRELDLKVITQEVLADRIGRVINQYPFQVHSWVVSGVYRARKNKPGKLFLNASELWYPPKPEYVEKPGRLNRVGQVVFYAADTPNTSAIELRVKPGDMFTVLVSRVRNGSFEERRTAFVGLARSLAPEAKTLRAEEMFRTAKRFREHLGEGNYKKWLLVDNYLSDVFGAVVPDGQMHLYGPTIALAEHLFKAPTVDAVTYPSVATNDHGINVCMLPSIADSLFAPSEAWMIEVGEEALHPETGEPLMQIRFRLRSREIGTDGVIHWRSEGDGLDQESIRRFVRNRLDLLQRWPTKS